MELIIPVAGGDLRADDSGGDGPPLVLLHPGIGDSRLWDPVLPRLAARHRVVRYDVRGYGRSPQPTGPYSLLADLVAVLDHLGLGRVALAGCSMGGGTALELALADPARVSSLVLLCPGVPDYPWPAEPELDAEYDDLVAAGDTEGLTRYGLRLWAAAGSDPAAEAQLRSAALAWPLEDVHQQPGAPLYSRLAEIPHPTRLLVGDRDRPALIESNRRIAARMPDCELTVLPGVDHLPPLRAPGAVADAILAHLAATAR